MKYIITNCPAIWEENNICTYTDNLNLNKCYCKNITDCLLKQIVELCKQTKETGYFELAFLADEILKLLEIEEVDE